MNFCPECGRRRTTVTRYCGGCGRDFGVAATAGSAELGAEPHVTSPRLDPDAEAPQPTMTMGPADPGIALPPEPTMPPNQTPDGRPGRSRAPWIVVTVVVLLAAGGGAFALVRTTGGRQAAVSPNRTPTVALRATAPPIRPANTPPASLQASTSPSASPTAPRSAPPSVLPSVVSVAPGVKAASAPVEIVLSHYFQGINDHNYAEYASSQTAQGKAKQSKSSFDSGYATTADSGMTLKSLTPTGQGDLTATVAFTSRQSPSDSFYDSPCDAWILNLYLVPDGAGYLITPAPSGYEPSHTYC